MTKYFQFSDGERYPIDGYREDGTPSIIFNPLINNISLDSKLVWDMIGDGNTKGVFQLESRLGQMLAKKLKPSNIEELAALVTIMRPGCMESLIDNKSVTEHYIDRKNKVEEVTPYHISITDILDETYQCLIYQEQCMSIVRKVAGFTLQQAHTWMKAAGKKKPEIMAKVKKEFMEGVIKTGLITIEDGEFLWDGLEKFQRYGFNKCISKDTKFMIMKNGTKTHLTVQEMYLIRNNIDYAKATNHLQLYKKWKMLGNYGKIYSMFDDKRVRPNTIENIAYAGEKTVYEIVLENGSRNKFTENHKFPTENGIQLLRDLRVGTKLYVCGEYEPNTKKYNFSDITTEEIYNREYSGCAAKDGSNNMCYTNGEYTKFIENKALLPNYCQLCNKENNRLETHHKDGNRQNNDISNLINLCPSCHKKEEYKVGRVKKGEKGYPTILVPIKEMNYIGIERVYDVTMAAPAHTFVTSEKIVTCNSHAVGYAMSGYLSAYAKAHFPKAFFASYLYYAKDKIKPHIEMAELINNARFMSVQVNPPDFRHLNSNFKVINKEIYFGLSNIKGVGESVIKSISANAEEVFKKLGKKTGDWSWTEFLIYFSQNVNKTAIKGLINSGGLSYMRLPRYYMNNDYDKYSELSAREQKWIQNNFSGEKTVGAVFEKLISGGTGKEGGIANVNRLAKVESLLKLVQKPPEDLKDDPEWIASIEKELLGLPITCTIVDKKDISAANCNCLDVLRGDCPQELMLAAQIDMVKETVTKKGKDPGKAMAFLTVSDINGAVESVILFPEVWKEFQHVCVPGNTVMIGGNLSKTRDSLLVQKIWQI